MVAHRWKKRRRFLKQTTGRLVVVAVCVSVSGIWFVCVHLRSRADNPPGSLATPTSVTRSRLVNVSLDITAHPRDFRHTKGVTLKDPELDANVFRSPFIVDREQEIAGALPNLSFSLDSPIRTIAVVWPCKGSHGGCFIDTSFPIQTCGYSGCRQTWTLEEADVVVFYVYRFKSNDGVPRFRRPPHQRWVMLTPEAPSRGIVFGMLDFPALRGQFNWTQTYRLDSDIPHVYGKLQQIEAPEKNYDQIWRGKNVTAAWFVSHCDTPSRRQEYVQRMQRVADIHVYGSCGNYTCKDNSQHSKRVLDQEQCLPLLSKLYFFYLAFENSICVDYVTEKFFKTFRGIDVIPVVRGGADYKRFFPSGTYIDASEFRSPEDLGRFLLALARDRDGYVRMLKEKSRYRLGPTRRWFCELCEKIYQDEAEKSYLDLREWYVQGQCHDPDDM